MTNTPPGPQSLLDGVENCRLQTRGQRRPGQTAKNRIGLVDAERRKNRPKIGRAAVNKLKLGKPPRQIGAKSFVNLNADITRMRLQTLRNDPGNRTGAGTKFDNDGWFIECDRFGHQPRKTA